MLVAESPDLGIKPVLWIVRELHPSLTAYHISFLGFSPSSAKS